MLKVAKPLSLVLCALCLAVGCGDGATVVGGPDGSTGADVANDLVLDLPFAADNPPPPLDVSFDLGRPARCSAFERDCAGVCTDVGSDRSNCGACGRRCPDGQACVAGSCQDRCGQGEFLCGERCVDLRYDRANCGACGTRCTAEQVCSGGSCAAACSGMGVTECRVVEGERYCAELQSSRRDCGACGSLCALGQACALGRCVTACPAEQTLCDTRCVNTRTDRENCGACGMRCTTGQLCSNGLCSLECGSPLMACGEAAERRCVDPRVDPNNCGTCGTECRDGEVCRMGVCTVTCPTDFTVCPGAAADGGTATRPYCANLRNDRLNCGMCGTACPDGQSCVDGACMLVCQTGSVACAGQCRDPQTDNAHCGMCNNACPSGQACQTGMCRVTCNSSQMACGMTCRDLQTDLDHCGMCANACPRPANASSGCAMGRCASSCNAGFADCDNDAANGCEADLRSSTSHCGMCRAACATPNGTPACNNGECAVGRCDVGRGDCDNNVANGCETDLNATATHCGGCGRVCNLANATPACTAGQCAVATCATGFANCDGMAPNGCEVNTRSDNENCGACGTRCAAGQLCSAGTCVFNCPSGQTSCTTGCQDLQTSTANCGGCGNACPARANATPTCSAGTCGFACLAGFADCDGMAANGCEVDTRVTAEHCGTCRSACTVANATPACAASACALGTCNTGFADCDNMLSNGCEVDTRVTTAHCGSCGRRCAVANAVAGCSAGQCTVASCTAPFGDCDLNAANGCETNLQNDNRNCGGCGRACPSSQACLSGTCTPLTSCRTLRDANNSLPNGVYTIDPDGAGAGAALQVYCDMANGGWTLVMMAGTDANSTLGYNSTHWTTASTLNPTVTDPATNTSMKNAAFNTLAVTEMRFCLASMTSCVVETITATSALALFQRAETSRGNAVSFYAPWGYNGGLGCNRNGFNVFDVGGGPARYRYGILWNNESACEGSVDGGRGFGGHGYYGTEISAGQGDGIVSVAHQRGWVWVR